MSEPRPPEPGVEDPAADGPDAPAPVNLSEPEPEPEPVDASPAVPATAPATESPGAGPGAVPTTPAAPAEGEQTPPLPPPPADVTGDTGLEPGRSPGGGQAWKMVLVVVVFLAVVVGAYLLGKKGGGESQPAATATSSTSVNTTPVNTAGWVTSTVDDAGFTIKHPKDWETLPSTGDVRLLFRIGPESVLGISARDVDASDAPPVIQKAMSDVELIENPRDTSINGLPAVVYIYKKPVTEASPAEGSVVHYFALSKSRMYALVFVTTPPEELNRLALTIGAVADTFKSTLDPPDGLTTTTPATLPSEPSTTTSSP